VERTNKKIFTCGLLVVFHIHIFVAMRFVTINGNLRVAVMTSSFSGVLPESTKISKKILVCVSLKGCDFGSKRINLPSTSDQKRGGSGMLRVPYKA